MAPWLGGWCHWIYWTMHFECQSSQASCRGLLARLSTKWICSILSVHSRMISQHQKHTFALHIMCMEGKRINYCMWLHTCFCMGQNPFATYESWFVDMHLCVDIYIYTYSLHTYLYIFMSHIYIYIWKLCVCMYAYIHIHDHLWLTVVIFYICIFYSDKMTYLGEATCHSIDGLI